MKLLITGSNGYVGNFLSRYFSDKGIPVVGIDIASDKRQQKYPNFRFEKCDVRNKDRLYKIFEKERPTHVIHLAYLMDPLHDRDKEDAIDVDGSINVFLAAGSVKTVKQFIHFSSASVYGGWKNNQLWVTEDRQPKPRDWAYAINKVRVEQFYFNANKRKDMNLVNFRMCTAVGPSYYKKGSVVSTLAKAPLGLFLDGRDTELQFIHEDDVKKLVELVLNDKKIEGTYNLAPDSYASTKQLNSRKIFLKVPKILFRWIIALLWYTWLSPISPTSVNLIAHGIVVSPKRLMGRYNYTFQYSTKEAYDHAVKERKKRGLL